MRIRKLFNFGVVFLLLLPALLTKNFTPAQAAGGEVPFGARRVVTTAANGAKSVYAADVDGDGDLDVLSASELDDEIAWYENDGASPPAFTMRTITTLADNAKSVTAADVDGDGDVDVLSASRDDDTVVWYENDGGSPPAFNRRVVTTAADGAHSVYAADVDSDGDLDVLCAAQDGNEVAWYENNGGSPPAFNRRVITTAAADAVSVYAADMDDDGDLDVLSASYLDDRIAWYENNGASPPVFAMRTITTSAVRAMSVYAADVDGDGDVDVLSASRDDDTIAWYQNNGASPPTFTRYVIVASADGADAVYAADVDGDGDVDALSSSAFDHEIAWYENNGNALPAFTARAITNVADSAQSVYAADMDSDGDLDVLSASYGDDAIAWYPNQTIHRSALYPIRAIITSAADGVRSVRAADVDDDGDVDVLSASYEDGRITWYENNGSSPPAFTSRVVATTASSARSVHTADVDGDGNPDILSASEGDDTIAWYESNGGSPPTFTRRVITTLADGARWVYTADLDNDGDLDVLSASSYDDEIAWYENDGGSPPGFTSRIITNSAVGARSVHAADLDNDGDVDVLSASVGNDTVAWYENNGASPPTFTTHNIAANADGAHSVYTADVDGDGDMDVLAACRDNNTVFWYENNGASPPSFASHAIITNANGVYSVYAADLDGDGDVDVLSAPSSINTAAWYENNGGSPPGFVTHLVNSFADGANSIYAADLNGDGALDILSASADSDTVAWYENRGGQFALTTTDTAPSTIFNGQQDDVLRIVAAHRGRSGDADAELATLDLLFEENASDPLSTTEANNLIQNLHIYRDTGSGTFEPGVDPLVITVGALSLTAGRQTVVLADGDSDARLVFGAPVTYFVATELTGNAAAQTPHQFRVTHVTQSSSTAEDRDRDLPLTLEFTPNVASSIVTAAGSSTPTFTPTPTQTPTVTPTPPQGSVAVYLPAVLKRFVSYAPPCGLSNNYCEEYNTPQTAYGPLKPGQTYQAYPNDEKDYYYFLIFNTASIRVDVANYDAVGWLIVRQDNPPDFTAIGWDERKPGEDKTLGIFVPNLSPGKYYIQVYTTSDYNQNNLYTLTVTQ